MEGRSHKTEAEGSHPERMVVRTSFSCCGRCRSQAVFLLPK